MTAPEVMDAETAAILLGISLTTVRRLASAGRVPARKCGREWRFSRQALHNWLEGKLMEERETERERDRSQLVAVSAGFVGRAIRQGAR